MIPSSHIMMTNPTLPSSSSFTCDWTYDVFLNFRGVDTRHNFTGNLYNSLRQKGIETFIDDEGLNKGEEIKPGLLKAIKESRIFIAIFSKDYASSTFCLDELVMMLECSRAQERLLLPVFYDVEPTHIRHQTGTYAEAMAEHEKQYQDDKGKIKVQKWREALTQAASKAGWHFKDQDSTQEYEFIGKIVEEVCKKIGRIPLHVADNPVGLESPVQEVISLLGIGSGEGVKMIGICGAGGIGKSTIARAVYNLIADQFEGLCFLDDIKEEATKHGLARLQGKLLSELLGDKDITVGHVNKGIPIIKRRLKKKKVLLILDDVDKQNQLEALGRHEWFDSESKIIITTRDRHVLASHKVITLYEVKQLNYVKALELFSWHAFKRSTVDPKYANISKRAIAYAGGHPLALKVIGSYLYGKKLEVWKSVLDKYERIPHKDIYDTLKISYDNLDEDEKEVFLDIACFFNSVEKHYVRELLYSRGFHAEVGIEGLIDKSLITIDRNDCVRMHDLIQDMGREIVRQESKSEPGKRTRLWSSEEIVNILEENKGTNAIEVIIVDLCEAKVDWSGKAFENMQNLRFLIIRNGRFSIGPQNLPNSLRVLDWSGYPSQSLPPDFKPKNLAILSLHESFLKLFKPFEVFKSLCFLDFEGCKFLTQLPDLSGVPNLGALCLDDCINLTDIHHSVGFLDKLWLLTAQGCTQLDILVPAICLTSLETLDLRGCSSLGSFPKVLGVMEKIRDVYLDQTAIKKLPFSIGNLVGLQLLFLRECHGLRQLPSSIHLLSKVEIVMDYGCRGFQLSEDKEKVGSERVPRRMRIYNIGFSSKSIDMYSLYINPNNVIEVGISVPGAYFYNPFWDVYESMGFRSPFRDPDERMDSVSQAYSEELTKWCKFLSEESSVKFWFQKKFPKIVLYCIGEPDMYNDNMVFMDFKLSVLINGAKQLTSSCNYIFSTREVKKDIILCCNVQCKEEDAFAELDWNEAEILCELDYSTPGRVMATKDKIPKWSLIYVYPENQSEDVKFNNPQLPLSLILSQELEQMVRVMKGPQCREMRTTEIITMMTVNVEIDDEFEENEFLDAQRGCEGKWFDLNGCEYGL